ncbi:hypothetical protein Sm713_63520 [Streptomyces sp. TS71-3]|nr:hypothetical protein Sm713_63520 [Streptomyces sp. TS71-3]
MPSGGTSTAQPSSISPRGTYPRARVQKAAARRTSAAPITTDPTFSMRRFSPPSAPEHDTRGALLHTAPAQDMRAGHVRTQPASRARLRAAPAQWCRHAPALSVVRSGHGPESP